MWLKVSGILRYEPHRRDFRKTYKQKTLIVELPRDDLSGYYAWFLKTKYGTCYELQPPMFGLHVTIVRGDERPKYQEAWKRHEGRRITIEYDPERLTKVWSFWSIDVKSTPELIGLRDELGLTRKHAFHITIGREYPHLAQTLA